MQDNSLHRKHFYTQKLLHTEVFTHRRFCAQTLLHTETFTHKSFHTQKLLQTDTFTHRPFYTQTLVHTKVFTLRSLCTDAFYTKAFTHRRFYTQTPLHTDGLTHRHFDTEHTKAFKQTFLHKRFYTDAFYTQKLCTQRKNCNFTSVFGDRPSFCAKGLQREPGNRNFTSVFGDRTSFRAKGLRRTTCKSQFYLSFWWSSLISCERVAPDDLQIAMLPQFLAIEPHFVRRGCAGRLPNRTFTSVFGDRTSFHAKGLHRTTCKSQFYLSFWRSNLISCEGVAFRAVSLALPLLPPSKREIEKKETARGQEGKRRRCEMRRCEDEKMWEDVRRCEKMWRWEDVRRC